MINPRRQHNQIPLLQPNPHPLIALTPHIEEARAIQDVPDFLVLVQVLVEERLHFFFVDGAHLLGRDGDFVPVLVVALFG